MSTADDLIKEVQAGFSGMANDLDALDDFTGLLCVLLTAPDFEECLGLHRLILVIPDHLRAAKDRQVSGQRRSAGLQNPDASEPEVFRVTLH